MFQTVSGRLVDIAAMRPSDVDLQDIAWSLSRQLRYLGHSLRPVSVAEHSLLVAQVVAATHPHLRLQALLHDASEAYVGDLPQPVKRLLPDYSELEHRVQAAILQGLGVAAPTVEQAVVIKAADLAVLAAEREQCLLPGNDREWSLLPEPARVLVKGLDPDVARTNFLQEFQECATCA